MKSRHRSGGFQLGRTFTIVVALHLVVGSGVLWLSKTTAGQAVLKRYDIKLFEPAKPPEPEQQAKNEPPPPPPKVEQPATPPPSAAPQVASVAPSAPQIGGAALGGGGASWSGKFSGGSFDGPLGAFHASVLGRFRKHWSEPDQREQFQTAEIQLVVTGSGTVKSYRLLRSSGNQAIDRALLDVCAKVQAEGVGQPPEEQRRGSVVTVRFVPALS